MDAEDRVDWIEALIGFVEIKGAAPDSVEEAMEAIKANFGGDPEVAHSYADRVLCAVLRFKGYDGAIMVYDEIDKWYA